MDVDERTQQRWHKLINTMNIPAERTACTVANLRWFLRNGQLMNQHHKDILQLRQLVVNTLNRVET